MASYQVPTLTKPPKVKHKQVLLVASGDLRLSANQNCWPAQKEMEAALGRAVAEAGYELVCAHPYKEDEQDGFIGSQKEEMCVFAGIDPAAKVIVAEAFWQHSHRVPSWLLSHTGPVLIVGNGPASRRQLAGVTSLASDMREAGVRCSAIGGEIAGEPFVKGLKEWLHKGWLSSEFWDWPCRQDEDASRSADRRETGQVSDNGPSALPQGEGVAATGQARNAPDELLHRPVERNCAGPQEAERGQSSRLERTEGRATATCSAGEQIAEYWQVLGLVLTLGLGSVVVVSILRWLMADGSVSGWLSVFGAMLSGFLVVGARRGRAIWRGARRTPFRA